MREFIDVFLWQSLQFWIITWLVGKVFDARGWLVHEYPAIDVERVFNVFGAILIEIGLFYYVFLIVFRG